MVRGGGWVKVVAMIVLGMGASSGAAALGQVTRVATFENYVEGQGFKPSFTDPLSGITFRDATAWGNEFDIDYTTGLFSSGTNFLTSGIYVPGDGWGLGYAFGFTADLPSAARNVAVDVAYVPVTATSPAGMTLAGYDAAGVVVAQTTVPGYVASPFRLEASSSGYDIVRMMVTVPRIGVGYDNVSYTVLPEPAGVAGVLVGAGVVVAGKRRGRTLNVQR